MSEFDPVEESWIEALREPAAYPDDPSAAAGVQEIQTHLSHVFLTADRVYKLRKPVELPFVDFRSRAERTADCVREVRLNRRLAPDVYLGIAPVLEEGGRVRVGPIADLPGSPTRGERTEPESRAGGAPQATFEFLVVMRRLPDRRDALSLLERGELEAGTLDALAEILAGFHELERLDDSTIEARDWIDSIEGAALDNCDSLQASARRGLVESAVVERLVDRTRAALVQARPSLVQRLHRGRAVDGHGDLHLQHVWIESPAKPPILIDCLEFSDDLRRIDAAADVAFLAMDLAYRNRRDLAERFLRAYAEASNDFDLYTVVDLFVSYRAAVRSKVALVAAADPEIPSRQRDRALRSGEAHLELAVEALAPRKKSPLIVVCGRVGTGKSTAARALAEELPAVAITADRVRKHLLGLKPAERVAAGEIASAYSESMSDRVYEALLERAACVLESGRAAILDATYAQAKRRRRVLEWAHERGVSVALVETHCAPELVLARLAERERAGADPSDAGPELYRALAPRFEPPDEWPEETRFTVDMGSPDSRAAVARISLELVDRLEP